MSRIFISHSSQDNVAAAQVADRLMAKGHRSIFLDFHPEIGIPAGRHWEQELYTNLQKCQAVIVLCSKHSMASPWCFAEITHARALGKELFPIIISSCKVVGILKDKQVIDIPHLGEEESYHRLWRGLKKAGLDPQDLFDDWDEHRPPYPGLLSFEETSAAIYFGRDRMIQEGLETLKKHRNFGGASLILFLGPSGSGKSSLVKAGIVPRLKRDQHSWVVIDPFRPKQEPLHELSQVIAQAYQRYKREYDVETIHTLLEKAANNPSACINQVFTLLKGLQTAAQASTATVLLIIDQLEELLEYPAETANYAFLGLVKALLEANDSTLLVVSTLRSDYLAMFQEHPIFSGLAFDNLPIKPMDAVDMEHAITGPATIADLQLEAGLAQMMVRDTKTADALPLLAYTLRELWEGYRHNQRLGIKEYENLGKLEGAVATAAEAVLANYLATTRTKQDAVEKELRIAFLQLAHIDEDGKYSRRIARWQYLSPTVHPILDAFVEKRLLVSSGDDQDKFLEVSHESLFRVWHRLADWLRTGQEFLFQRDRLESNAAQWQKKGQPSGYLLIGQPLKEAIQFQRQQVSAFPLSELANIFIQKSIQHRHWNRLKTVSWLIIPALVVYIAVEPMLRVGRIQQALEQVKKGGDGTREAVEFLVKGCRANQQELRMPKFLVERLFGSCISLENYDLEDINLRGANLQGANLRSSSLRGTNFQSADLSHTDLRNTDLRDTNFLRSAKLSQVNLRGANLQRAQMSSAILEGADLRGADFREADLSNANLSHALLSDAKFDDGVVDISHQSQGSVEIQPHEITKVVTDQYQGGFGYRYIGPGLELSAPDDLETPKISQLVLLENGIPLQTSQASHGKIQSIGEGRYSHWDDGEKEYLYFSTSDNSDPRTNNRTYTVEHRNLISPN